MNVLIIDDQPETLELIKDILEEEGLNTIACSESHESLKILDKNKVHCVITDLRMPILEGKELIQIIRAKYPTLPIIVLSGHMDSREEILGLGVFEALRKPVSRDKLVSAVQEGISEGLNQITFHFNHINLRKIKDTVKVRLVRHALKKSKGNKLQASKLLGISRQSLIRYVKDYKIEV